MFERIECLGWHTSLVQQLRLDQAVQFLVERPVVELRHRLEQGIRELPTNRGTKLGDDFGGHQPVQPCHERILERSWNGQRAYSPCKFVLPIDFFEGT